MLARVQKYPSGKRTTFVLENPIISHITFPPNSFEVINEVAFGVVVARVHTTADEDSYMQRMTKVGRSYGGAQMEVGE